MIKKTLLFLASFFIVGSLIGGITSLTGSDQVSSSPYFKENGHNAPSKKQIERIKRIEAVRGYNREGSRESGEGRMPYLRIITATCLIVGFFLVGVAGLKRLDRFSSINGTERAFRILARYRITPKAELVHFKLNNREYLISCGTEKISVLDQFNVVRLKEKSSDININRWEKAS